MAVFKPNREYNKYISKKMYTLTYCIQRDMNIRQLIVFTADSPNPMGFEPMINQRLLPPTFPRYTRIKPRLEALQYCDELVTRLRHAWKITSATNFHTALVSLYTTLKPNQLIHYCTSYSPNLKILKLCLHHANNE